MLKIEFFSPEKIKYYEEKIADEVKRRNGGNDEIVFIPPSIARSNTGAPYKISIKKLLTSERDEVFKTDGMELYNLICSVQKYKYLSNVELLHALISKHKHIVNEINYDEGNYEYKIGDVHYQTTRIADKSDQYIIGKAARLIRDELIKYNTNYAYRYFYKRKIKSVDDLKEILGRMSQELEKSLYVNGSKKPSIDYSIMPGDLRHELISSLGIRTCPFCNRNYITSYGKGKNTTADLDHFYQKRQYPLFALSLFNFIPSCQICNSRMKGTRPAENTLYPYNEGFENDTHFELKYTGTDKTGAGMLHLWQGIKNLKYTDFSIEIATDPTAPADKIERIENSKELFRLEDVYADHRPEALEAALRTRIYCEGSYKKFCEKLFDKCERFGMNNSSVSDLESYMIGEGFDNEWLMFGIFMDDEKRRYDKPLSKMIYDIYHSTK